MPGKTKSTRGQPAKAAEDVQMEEAPPAEPQPDESSEELEEEEDEVEDQRVKILPGSTDTAASFEFLDEGHTLGNALRYIIMKNPDVEFCAYAIPHPSEPKMNIRIQTYEGKAVTALRTGLVELQKLCDHVAQEFWEAKEDFDNTMST